MKKYIAIAVVSALAPLALADIAVVKGDEDGTYKLQGSNTSLGLYGFVHLDVLKDLQAGTNDWAYDAGSVGITSDPSGVNTDSRQGKFNVNAQTSRIGFKSVSRAEVGTVRTKLEGDFVGNTLRLRHAFGEIESGKGKFLAGQTWGLFRSGEAIPETLDFNGHGSVASNRKPQLRYTVDLGAAGSLAAAIELPATTLAASSSPVVKTPAVTGAWAFSGSAISASLRGIVNPVSYATVATTSTPSTAKTKYGYGASFGGSAKLGSDDTLQALLVHGKGISAYVGAANYNKEVVSASNIVLTQVNAATLGWQHVWAKSVRSNLSYGQTRLGDEYQNAVGTPANKKIDSAFANAVWTVAPNTEIGAELAYGQRELSNGVSGKYSRLQTSFHYGF